jgi:L-Ala-D/L-Glu epimerase
MQLTYKALTLPLEFTFTIARSSQTEAETVLLELVSHVQGQPVTGIGEAVPAPFYGETAATTMAFYNQLVTEGALDAVDPLNRQQVTAVLARYPGHYAAKAAIDMACWDIAGKQAGMPVYAMLGLDPTQVPKTSYTLGIAPLPEFRHKLAVAQDRGHDVLKIKLGGPEDWACMDLVRQACPNATIRVDANAAWTLPQAQEGLQRLADWGVEFVEEPLRLDSPPADYATLLEQTPLPLMADESCHRLADVPRCAPFFHAVNLKLSKTGGLTETLRMIYAARAHELKIMLGCFTETTLSITAMAQLSPLVDYADLDGHLLIKHSPFAGVELVAGSQLVLPTGVGLGVTPR